MSVYIIDDVSQVLEIFSELGGHDLNVVVPTYADVFCLEHEISDGMRSHVHVFSEHEWRKNLLSVAKVDVCSKSESGLFFQKIFNQEEYQSANSTALSNSKRFFELIRRVSKAGLSETDLDTYKLCYPAVSAFVWEFLSVLEKNGLTFNGASDSKLLSYFCHQGNTSKKGEHVIFYGFPQFGCPLALMRASSKYCAHCDAVVYDICDRDWFYNFVTLLEKIFGDNEYRGHGIGCLGSCSIEFNVYDHVTDEVAGVIDRVKHALARGSDSRVAVCFSENHREYLPMIADKLADDGIKFSDMIGRQANRPQCLDLISFWCEWQKSGSVDMFCRFCSELVANDMLDQLVCENIFRDVSDLQKQCLFKKFNILFEYANYENRHSFDAVDDFNFLNSSYKFGDFVDKFLNIFDKIISDNIRQSLCGLREKKYKNEVFPRQLLVDYIKNFLDAADVIPACHDPSANVVLLDIDVAWKYDFSDIFVVGIDSESCGCRNDDDLMSIFRMSYNCDDATLSTMCWTAGVDRESLLADLSSMSRMRGIKNLVLSYSRTSSSNIHSDCEPSDALKYLFFEKNGKYLSENLVGDLLKQRCNAGEGRGECDARGMCDTVNYDNPSIKMCVDSYHARHDKNSTINEYCFSRDVDADALPCKSIEFLLKNPHVGFYSTVIKCDQMPWLCDNCKKDIAVGTFAHDFLQIKRSSDGFDNIPSRRDVEKNIFSRYDIRRHSIEAACSACDETVPYDTKSALEKGLVFALQLNDRIFEHVVGNKYFCSEHTLPKCSNIKFGKEALNLTGRVDLVLSNCKDPYVAAGGCDITIIDFKTGKDPELTDGNIGQELGKDYNGMQLFLYGLAMMSSGIKHPKIMILKPDSSASVEEISVDYVLQEVPDICEKLAKFADDGLVEKRVLGKSFRKYFLKSIPMCTTDLF